MTELNVEVVARNEPGEKEDAERARIMDIISRYYLQIRFGCGYLDCRTPTCLTFEGKRSHGAPYRIPTVLSARAMAACLSMTPNPTARLCPHGQLPSSDASDQAFASVSGDLSEELDRKSLMQVLFNSRAWRLAKMSPSLTASTKLASTAQLLGEELRANPRAINVSLLCAAMDTLCDFLPRMDKLGSSSSRTSMWLAWVALRRSGRYLLAPAESRKPENRRINTACRELADAYQDENALRLVRHILITYATLSYNSEDSDEDNANEFELLAFLAPDSAPLTLQLQKIVQRPWWHEEQANRLASTAEVMLEWARVMLQHSWDNKPLFSWSGMVGCAIEFLRFLYKNRLLLQLDKKLFEMPYLFKRTDFMEIPRSWMENSIPTNHGHLLSFPWLFPVSSLVTYFRVINHSMMSRAVNSSVSLQYLINRHKPLVESHDDQIFERLRTALDQLLVLEIKRHNILEDAMNELWRRQKRELRRPLKVRMGMDEGEEGVDFGGVQQEFFRLSLGEALDPDYGLFITDDTTRMTWFLPCSKAPLHHFTLIGILVGLAVYNGITLSVTFPEALYRKLLGEPVDSLEHIEDGWPTLTKGLRSLLTFEDGDVADVFVRSYVFSAETNGSTVSADMAKHGRDEPWPGPNGLESSDAVEAGAALVTNENRERYVQDYIFWLTDKSIRPQYEAFATGFFLCVEKQPLRLFDPLSFRTLVEGYQTIDIDALQRTASYDNGYHAHHEVIMRFWDVLRSFSPVEVRKLLEFVTASDRVPAKGIEEIVFIIQRNGGRDDERLPTSQTCFGRLLLPEYSTKAVLEEKLRQAMVHSMGFYLQ